MGSIRFFGDVGLFDHEGYLASVLDDVPLGDDEIFVKTDAAGVRYVGMYSSNVYPHIVGLRPACSCGWLHDTITAATDQPDEPTSDRLMEAWHDHTEAVIEALPPIRAHVPWCQGVRSYWCELERGATEAVAVIAAGIDCSCRAASSGRAS